MAPNRNMVDAKLRLLSTYGFGKLSGSVADFNLRDAQSNFVLAESGTPLQLCHGTIASEWLPHSYGLA